MSITGKLYNQKKALDFVIMNEDLCFHRAEFPIHQKEEAFAMPEYIYTPQTTDHEVVVTIRCPICHKKYYEASKRMKKEIMKFTFQLSKTNIRDEGYI